jgi:hypothetical protein
MNSEHNGSVKFFKKQTKAKKEKGLGLNTETEENESVHFIQRQTDPIKEEEEGSKCSSFLCCCSRFCVSKSRKK